MKTYSNTSSESCMGWRCGIPSLIYRQPWLSLKLNKKKGKMLPKGGGRKKKGKHISHMVMNRWERALQYCPLTIFWGDKYTKACILLGANYQLKAPNRSNAVLTSGLSRKCCSDFKIGFCHSSFGVGIARDRESDAEISSSAGSFHCRFFCALCLAPRASSRSGE